MTADRMARYVKLGVAVAILLILAVTAYALLHPERRFDIIVVMVGILLGVVAAYYFYHSFSFEEEPLRLPDERVLVETSGKDTYVNVVDDLGGFISKNPPIKVNLYLTEKAIIIEPLEYWDFVENGEFYVFRVDHSTILRFSHEKRWKADYLRITFRGADSKDRDMLLFPGEDAQKWVNELEKLLA